MGWIFNTTPGLPPPRWGYHYDNLLKHQDINSADQIFMVLDQFYTKKYHIYIEQQYKILFDVLLFIFFPVTYGSGQEGGFALLPGFAIILFCFTTCFIQNNRMAWQWAQTLVEIRGTLADIRGTTK